MATTGSSMSGYSVSLSEICYGYDWQFSARTFFAIE
jgi:hypothetical protein